MAVNAGERDFQTPVFLSNSEAFITIAIVLLYMWTLGVIWVQKRIRKRGHPTDPAPEKHFCYSKITVLYFFCLNIFYSEIG